MTGVITEAQVRRAIDDQRTFERGAAYHRERRARILTHRRDGQDQVIESEVRGSEPEPYRQTIRVDSHRGATFVDGHCNCPVGFNCKHVAAALLTFAEQAADPFAVPAEVEKWLGQVRDALRRDGEQYPPEVRQRALYLLDADEAGDVVVRPLSARLDARDRIAGAPKTIDAGQANGSTPAKYLRLSDLAMLRQIAWTRVWGRDHYALKGPGSGAALAGVVASGRCHWRTLDGPVLRTGSARPATGAWAPQKDALRFRLHPGKADDRVLNLDPPLYLDLAAGLVGPLACELEPHLLHLLLEAPLVPDAVADDVAERLAEALGPKAPSAPLPKSERGLRTLRPAPQPVARICVETVKAQVVISQGWRAWGYRQTELPVLKAAFDYAGVRFASNDPRRAALVPGRAGERVMRDADAEKKLAAGLEKRGLRRLETIRELIPSEAQRKWLSFGAEAQPNDFVELLLGEDALEAQGWIVERSPEFSPALAQPDESEDWSFEVGSGSGAGGGVDWFELGLGVRVDGERLDILPLISELVAGLPRQNPVAALRAQARSRKHFTAPLGDGRILVLPLERVIPLVEGLLEIWGPDEIAAAAGRLSRFDAAAFGALRERVGDAVAWRGDEAIRRFAEAVRSWREQPPTPSAPDFAARLRPYQQAGLDWLQALSRAGFGGVLADEMGLGKTVQTLAHVAVEKAAGRLDRPALVVAPTSVLPNWRAEAERFAPALEALVLRGPDRARAFDRIASSDLVITSYPLLARDRDVLVSQPYSLAVLDEGQTIRNPATAAAQAAYAIDARQRLVLSGTPVENHLGDIWSLMRFLNPGLLGDAKDFARRFRQPIEKRGDAAAKDRLARRLQPFLLRRTIAEVAAELPPKSEVEERVELTAAQTELYEATRLVMEKRVRDALASRGLAKSSVIVLDALLKLRQVCCDPRLVPTASASAKAGGSAKLSRLLELVETLVDEGRPTLIFSQFTSMLALIDEALAKRGLERAWLSGDTKDREAPVRRFQSGKADVFLISLKAGGVGLNLTRAETVILYDPWWNPAVEAQAIGRAHRIGQERPVFVHRLIAVDSIEEKMLRLQAKKRGLAAALWSEDAGALGALTEADIRALFA